MGPRLAGVGEGCLGRSGEVLGAPARGVLLGTHPAHAPAAVKLRAGGGRSVSNSGQENCAARRAALSAWLGPLSGSRTQREPLPFAQSRHPAVKSKPTEYSSTN